MNPLLKTRTDYRHLKIIERSHPYFTYHWLIPILCVAFGFVLGVLFNKRESTFKGEVVAFSASQYLSTKNDIDKKSV